MSMTVHLMDAAKAAHRMPSDYALAKRLGIAPARMSNYRLGRKRFDDSLAVDVAKLAGLDPVRVLCELHAEKATEPELRTYWQRAAKMARQAAPAMVILSTMAAAPMPAPAASLQAFGAAGHGSSVDIM